MTDEERIRNVAAIMMALVGIHYTSIEQPLTIEDLLKDPHKTLRVALRCLGKTKLDHYYFEMARVALGLDGS